jgi:hypothetical protein
MKNGLEIRGKDYSIQICAMNDMNKHKSTSMGGTKT